MDASGLALQPTEPCGSEQGIENIVGDQLQRARLRAGASLDDIAIEIKISSCYLEAIEAMDKAALPPQAYALGFVRCYAKYLGLPAEDIAGQFKAQFYDDTPPLGDLSPAPAPSWVDFRLPKGTGITLVIVCTLALATWYGLRIPARTAAAVPAMPEALAEWSRLHKLDDIPPLSGTDASLGHR